MNILRLACEGREWEARRMWLWVVLVEFHKFLGERVIGRDRGRDIDHDHLNNKNQSPRGEDEGE